MRLKKNEIDKYITDGSKWVSRYRGSKKIPAGLTIIKVTSPAQIMVRYDTDRPSLRTIKRDSLVQSYRPAEWIAEQTVCQVAGDPTQLDRIERMLHEVMARITRTA